MKNTEGKWKMFSNSVETNEIFFQEFDKKIFSTRNTFSWAPSQASK